MDDMDTRLEAERPDVADVLRSMNWEERLERARARRKAVLTHNEATEKRPVVRIIDAAAVARKKSDPGDAAASAAEQVVPAPAVPAAADLAPAVRAEGAAVEPETVSAPADAPARSALIGRTALGFGLGLGLGTSLVAGAFLVFVALPDAVPGTGAPTTTAEMPVAESAAVRTDTVAESPPPPTTAPAVSAPVQQTAPTVASAGPDGFVSPVGAAAPEDILPAALPGPAAIRTSGAQPTAPGPDATLAAVAPTSSPVVADLAFVPSLPSAGPVAIAPVAWSDAEPASRGAADMLPVGSAPEAIPALEGAPYRPAPAVVAVRLPEALSATSDIRLPGGFASVLPVAFPVPPGAATLPEGAPAASIAPPVPQSVPHGIPDAERLFVRLAVPQTVPDAQAEEVAGLLRDVGVGDSRVARVGFKVSETHVRYYHAEDAAAAAALAEMVGTEARDRTSFRPSPPDGTVEIFLAGERTAPPPRAASPQRARAQPPDELTRMRDRIVNRLRRGEHL